MNKVRSGGITGWSATIWIGVMIVAATGCQQLPTQERNRLESEVMEIHDAVMPRTSDIQDLIAQLDTLIAHPATDSLQRAAMDGHRDALQAADSLMWDWMYGYSPPSREARPDSVRAYFAREKEKIQLVSDTMLSSIDRATRFLKTLDQ